MEHLNRSRWNPRLPFLIGGAIAILLILFSFFRDMGIAETWKLFRTRERILTENRMLREENQRLQQEVEKLRTNPSVIEEIARKELGLVHKKENVIVLDRKKERSSPVDEKKGAARP